LLTALVTDAKGLKEPVALVIKQELNSIIGNQDITQFNHKFIEKGSNSVLVRLAGEQQHCTCARS